MTTTSAVPPRKLRNRILVMAPVLTLALGLAGCGGGGDDEDWTQTRPNGTFQPGVTSSAGASEPGGSSAATPSATGSATASPPAQAGATVTGASLAQRISAASAAAGPASFTVVATGPQPVNADGVASGTGKALLLQVKGTVSSMSQVEIVKKAGIVYLKGSTPMAGDKPWLKITSSAKDPFRQFYTTLFASLETSGDVGATSAVIGQMPAFTAAGTEAVGGVPCTKYTGRPPAAIAAKLMPSSYQQLSAATLKQSRSDVSVWVDSTGLIHRITTALKLPRTTSNQVARSLVGYANWGTAISVKVPPPSQIATPTQPQ